MYRNAEPTSGPQPASLMQDQWRVSYRGGVVRGSDQSLRAYDKCDASAVVVSSPAIVPTVVAGESSGDELPLTIHDNPCVDFVSKQFSTRGGGEVYKD